MQERRKVKGMRRACTTCGSQGPANDGVLVSSGPTSDPSSSSRGACTSLGLL